jgi:hypothetical protein
MHIRGLKSNVIVLVKMELALWSMINVSQYLSEELKAIIDPVIQRNAYFVHPENLLLSMITDEDCKIRELGCRRIIKSHSLTSSGLIRVFSIPKLNVESNNYHGLNK